MSSTDNPRSPLFGTATFSTLTPSESNTQSSSRFGSSVRSATPIPLSPSTDSDDADSAYLTRRLIVSPSPSYTNTLSPTRTFSDDAASVTSSVEAEEALRRIDDEFSRAEDALTEWSRGPTPTHLGYDSHSNSNSSSGSGSYGTPKSTLNTILDRERRILSTISERTEHNSSRPNSGQIPSRPIAQHSGSSPSEIHRRSLPRAVSPVVYGPSNHVRATSEPDDRELPPPGRRAGDLIAFFENTTQPPGHGHSRTASAPSPAGPRSPSPYSTSYGYGSRTRTSTSSGSSPYNTMSSLLSPPTRTTPSGPRSYTPTTMNTQTHTGINTNTYSTITPSSSTFTPTTPTTPTASSLRRPLHGSSRSPLTSVRNVVAAWKDRSPALDDDRSRRPGASGEGLFSLRRRAERGQMRLREEALATANGDNNDDYEEGSRTPVVSGSNNDSGSALLPPPFDLSELGQYADAKGNQEPLRIGLLWYLNVHAPPPYRWQRCQALLYPHMLVLSWIATGGGRGIVTLDLLNCTEVRSVPTPMHPSARDDVGTIAARMQSASSAEDRGGGFGEMGLMETLCPFQLLYSDGIERLGAESARERVRWVSAIWEALDRSVTIPDRSVTRSPTGSMRTIGSLRSTSTSGISSTASGSASTVFVPPLDTIPDLSDLQSISGSSSRTGSSVSRRPSTTRAADDAYVSRNSYLYPGDPRVIAPSRSSSLRRTASLTDLDTEFASAVSRARNARPGLGFALGLVRGGEGVPVTVSSGPRLGQEVRMSPPPPPAPRSKSGSGENASLTGAGDPGDGGSSGSGSRWNGSDTSKSSFFSSVSQTEATRERTTTNGTTTGFHITSGSETNIITSSLSYRRTESASYLGDSSSGSSVSDNSASGTPPSRLSRTREVRRRSGRPSSRSFTSIAYSSTGENASDGTASGSYTGTCTCTDTFTCSTCQSSSYQSSEPSREDQSQTPSSDSGRSPPTEPSSSNYQTAEVCSTEYETAEVCSTEYTTAEVCPTHTSEYITAEVCPTPAGTEYVTAEVCSTPDETEYETAECRCRPSEPSLKEEEEDLVLISPPREREEEERSDRDSIIPTPSEIPTIPSPSIHPEDISLPSSVDILSWPPTEASLTQISESVLEPSEQVQSSEAERTPTISTLDLTPSPALPSREEAVQVTPEVPSISSPTESSVTPSWRAVEETRPSRVASIEARFSPPTWPSESDRSYDSSVLVSPSIHSTAIREGPDISYETSGLRPSPSIEVPADIRLVPQPSGRVPATATPSSLSSITATPETISSPSTVSMRAPSETERSVPVTRTPSSVSTASSISMRSSALDARSLFEVPFARELPTEPSLLSTHRSPLSRPASRALPPRSSPLPSARPLPTPAVASPRSAVLSPSPAPSTPSLGWDVSVSTPESNAPSIRSDLQTIPSEPRTEILTHDVNRLLQYLHDIDQTRTEENRDLSDSIRAVREELQALSRYLHEKCAPAAAEAPPPVPRKDQSVGDSMSISDRSTRIPRQSEQPLPPVPVRGGSPYLPSRPSSRRVPIPLTPPPIRPASPSSLTSEISFLSSPHSDDFSLMEEVTYPPMQPPPSGSPPSSPSSPVSIPTSFVSGPPSISVSEPSSGSYISATSPSSPVSVAPSPTPSSVPTVRPRPQPDPIADIRRFLEDLRQRTGELREGQDNSHRMLEDLIGRPPFAPDLSDCYDQMQRIENTMRNILEQMSDLRAPPPPPPPPPPPESVPASSEPTEDSYLVNLLENLRDRQARPSIHMPTPRRPALSDLDQTLEQLLRTDSQGLPAPPSIQPPPQLIPFVYRPIPTRPRSLSPITEADLPPRPSTFPFLEESALPRPAGRRPHPPQYPPAQVPRPSRAAPSFQRPAPAAPSVSEAYPTRAGFPPRPEAFSDVTPDFLREVQERRRRRAGAPDGFYQPPAQDLGRPQSAPPDTIPPAEPESWYPRPEGAPGGPPPIGVQQGPPIGVPQMPGAVPLVPPAGPTLFRLPQFDDMMRMLRENRLAQVASIDQQREIMRYLRGLNDWLGRDVQDRQAELRSVSARVDRLRDEINARMRQPEAAGGPSIFQMPPPVPQGPVVPPVPPPPIHITGPMPQYGPMPGQVPFPQPVIPPVVPERHPFDIGIPGTATPSYSPVVPSPDFDEPLHYGPVPPSGPSQMIPGPPMPEPYRHEEEPYFPSSSSASPVAIQVQPGPGPGAPIFIEPSAQPPPPGPLYSPPPITPTHVHIHSPPRSAPRVVNVPSPEPERVHSPASPTGPAVIIPPPQQQFPPPPPPIIIESRRSPEIFVSSELPEGSAVPGVVPMSPTRTGPPVTVVPTAPSAPQFDRPLYVDEPGPSAAAPYATRDFGQPPSVGYYRGPSRAERSPVRTVVVQRPSSRSPSRAERTIFVDRRGRSRSPHPSDHVVAVLPPRRDHRTRTRSPEGVIPVSRSPSQERPISVQRSLTDDYDPRPRVQSPPPTVVHIPPSQGSDDYSGSPPHFPPSPVQDSRRTPTQRPDRPRPPISVLVRSPRPSYPMPFPVAQSPQPHIPPSRTPRTTLQDQLRAATPSRPIIPYTPSQSRVASPGPVHPVAQSPVRVSESPQSAPGPVSPPLPIGEPHFADPGRLGELERQMDDIAQSAAEAEDRHEQEYQAREAARDRLFDEHEARRDDESRMRQDTIWDELENRLRTLPPVAQEISPSVSSGPSVLPVPPSVAHGVPPPEPVSVSEEGIVPERAPEHIEGGAVPVEPSFEREPFDTQSVMDSARQAVHEATGPLAQNIIEMLREEFARERDAAEAERERLRDEAEAERARREEECQTELAALKDELARTRAELADERQQRMMEETDAREKMNQEMVERDEVVRGQLTDITNLVQEQRDACAEKKRVMDERWEEKSTRREAKDAKWDEMRALMDQMMQDCAAERQRAEEERAAAAEKPDIEAVLEALRQQNAELRELLNQMADSWRADSQRQHEEALDAVRQTAHEQVPFNVQGYLDDFSRALASEVRMLLGEVGRLREERRNLQHEIGFLLCTRSKYGPGGEFDPEWRPPVAPYMPEAPPPPPDAPPPPPPGEPAPARPAWRTVLPQSTRRRRGRATQAAQQPPPPEPPAPTAPSWSTWQPHPGFQPTPPEVESTLLHPPQSSPGLFGPRSPRTSMHEG